MPHKAERTVLADVMQLTEPEPPVQVLVEAPVTIDKAKMYYACGQRDLLAALCALIRMRGAMGVVREIPLMLQQYEPDHCHAKAVLREFHPGSEEYKEAQKRKAKET